MTRKEFESLAIDIRKEKFEGVSGNPLQFAIERAKFRQRQFAKLIEAGRQVQGSKTVSAKVLRFERSMKRLKSLPKRFETLLNNGEGDHQLHSGMELHLRVETEPRPDESGAVPG